jgi:hypothetical protein
MSNQPSINQLISFFTLNIEYFLIKSSEFKSVFNIQQESDFRSSSIIDELKYERLY